MKHLVTLFKNPAICLKELEVFIRQPIYLEVGRPLKRFGGLRPREILMLWLLSVVIEPIHKSNRLKICTDPFGGDGIIYDSEEKIAWATEHTIVSSIESKDIESLIIDSIEKKQAKGSDLPGFFVPKSIREICPSC